MYSTTDFYITAVLIAEKFKIKETTLEGPKDKVKRFHFEDSEELREVILKYMNGDLNGSYRGFKNSIECVKDMVHSS